MHPTITASVPLLEPPGWALAQRALFDLLDQAWRRFEHDFTGPDGRLTYQDRLTSRDGADDFYETFFNWPQLYLLGGADDLLPASERHWEGVTRELTELGMLRGEYERGYDWFHQGESMLLFYFLCMAAPWRWAERAARFAELYVDPVAARLTAVSPAPIRRCISAPSRGPLDRDPRLGAEMQRRMGAGDTAVNLAATGLVRNALLLSGEPRYRDWITAYV